MSRAPAIPVLALRYAQAAPKLRRSYLTIRRRAAAGQLPTIAFSERCRRVAVDGLRRMLGQSPLELAEDMLLSGVELAKALSLSPSSASRLIRAEAVPVVPWGGGARVPLGKLRAFIAERTEGGGR
ncbi:MAG: hypothetical protein ABSG38_16045 [Spirochaetia bacterium]|jgi:hypothetical protein